MPHAKFIAIEYPESDGKPMGETDLHRDTMFRHIELLKRYYAGQEVYVSGDLLVYYEQGNPKKFVVPDAFVVKGKKQQRRRIYKLWVERIIPQVVIETTSKKTKNRDLKKKPSIYAKIGVKEYFMYDPTGDYLDPPLQGHRLAGDAYMDILPDNNGALMSEELGLRLQIIGDELEFIRPETCQRLLTAEEERQQEVEARLAAEAEIVRLRQELDMLRKSSGS